MNGSQGWNRVRGSALVVLAMGMLAGCAPLPQTAGSAPVPPASNPSAPAPAVTPPAAHRGPAHASAAVDSTPSADAIRVLAAIPEPLTPSQQVSPPERAGRTLTMAAPESAYDTLRIERAADEDSAGVPVPATTQPLGNSASGTLVMPDTLSAPAVAPPEVQAPAKPPVTQPRVAGKECLRLQIAAPDERAKAESRQEAAQSLLVVPMVVEFEKGLYKVRTRDCMTRESADALKRRATDSGFPGSFVVNTAVTPPTTPAHKRTAPVTHRKRRTR